MSDPETMSTLRRELKNAIKEYDFLRAKALQQQIDALNARAMDQRMHSKNNNSKNSYNVLREDIKTECIKKMEKAQEEIGAAREQFQRRVCELNNQYLTKFSELNDEYTRQFSLSAMKVYPRSDTYRTGSRVLAKLKEYDRAFELFQYAEGIRNQLIEQNQKDATINYDRKKQQLQDSIEREKTVAREALLRTLTRIKRKYDSETGVMKKGLCSTAERLKVQVTNEELADVFEELVVEELIPVTKSFVNKLDPIVSLSRTKSPGRGDPSSNSRFSGMSGDQYMPEQSSHGQEEQQESEDFEAEPDGAPYPGYTNSAPIFVDSGNVGTAQVNNYQPKFTYNYGQIPQMLQPNQVVYNPFQPAPMGYIPPLPPAVAPSRTLKPSEAGKTAGMSLTGKGSTSKLSVSQLDFKTQTMPSAGAQTIQTAFNQNAHSGGVGVGNNNSGGLSATRTPTVRIDTNVQEQQGGVGRYRRDSPGQYSGSLRRVSPGAGGSFIRSPMSNSRAIFA